MNEHAEAEQLSKDLRLCESLFSSERQNRAHWEPIAEMVMPELLESADMQEYHKKKERRICGHAHSCVLKLAAAHGSFITPMAQKWFQLSPWYEQELDDSEWAREESWYSMATEIMHAELHKSNFYTEKHATDLDRCLPATGLMLAEGDEETPLRFTHIPSGTFALAESTSHEVNTVVRKIKMTPAQMVEEFGEEAVGEAVLKDFNDESKKYSTTSAYEVYHLVEPNPRGIKASKLLVPSDMPWRSVYINVTGRKYLRVGGYYEFPYFATRFNRYGASPYGRSPLAGVVDDIRDHISLKYFNFINAQKKTMPPVLITAEIEGEVDMRAGGKTIVSRADAELGLPREWASAGDIRDSLQQLADLEHKIDQATYVDVIQAVTQTTKQMTATEVNALETERLLTFSPSFMQYVTDFRPMINRIFCILVRQGKINIDDAPDGIVNRFISVDGQVQREEIIPPNVSYIGKMAQTIQQVQQNGLNTTLQELVTLYKETGSEEWVLPIDIENVVRFKLNAAAVPYRCTRSPERVKQIREQMQAEREAQMQAQLAEQASVAQRNIAQAQA